MIGEIITGVLAFITICFLVAILESYHNEAKENKRREDLRNKWREE